MKHAEKLLQLMREYGITGGRKTILKYLVCRYLNLYQSYKWKKQAHKITENYHVIKTHVLFSPRIGECISRCCGAVADFEANKQKGTLDIFILSDYENVNKRFIDIFKRNICIIASKDRAFWLYMLKRFGNLFDRSEWEKYLDDVPTAILNSEQTSGWTTLTKREEREGQRKLQKMNIKVPFVCFHNRDASYLAFLDSKMDWSYHDFRDFSVQSYRLLADYMKKQKIDFVRMGRIVNETPSFECTNYAEDYYDEFMDIYLTQKCKFYIGASSGLAGLPMMQNTRVVMINFPNIIMVSGGMLSLPQNPNDLFIFQKLYDKKQQRFLNLVEMMQMDMETMYNGHAYEELGIDIIKNTAEEILDVAVEMNERIDGKWIESEEDRMLQDKFFTIRDTWIEEHKLEWGCQLRYRVGAKFLRENRFLFEV